MPYEPLHHKYRPQTFADLVGQEAIATTLTNAIRTSKIAPAYLFTGPRGTGKTSSARILAKSLNCLKSDKPTEQPCGVCLVCKGIANGSALDVIEIDAASNTGVENIRELIERAQFAPVQCRYKVYVIDECHMLSVSAFNALLKTLEEPPAQVVFILATTDPQRVLPTIISRCQRFDFRRIAIDAMVKHLRKIAFKEHINITPEAMQVVAQVAQGGLRDAESLLDQLSLLPCQVTVERVWDLVGSCSEPDLIALLQAIAQNNPEAILDCAHTIMDRGREPLAVLQNLAGFYRDLLIAKTAPHRNDLVALTPPTWMELCEKAKSWDTVTILAGQQHLAKSEVQIKNTTQPRLWLEVTLLGLLPSANIEQRTVLSIQPVQSISKHSKPRLEPITAQQPTAHHDSIPSEAEDVKETQTTTSPSPTTSVAEEHSEPRHATSQPAETNAHPTDLEQVWQLFLSHLQPYSTQVLLRQHGCLLTFEEQQALIGIRSEALLKMAKPGLSNMEAAFQAAFHHKVKVSLEVALPAQKSQATDGNSFTKTKIQPPTNGTDVTPGVVTKPAATPSPEAMEQPQSPVTPSDKATLSADSEENEVAIAAQSLADFFRGEVVKFNLDPTFCDSENQNSLPPVTTPALEWDDADLSIAEADIDF